MIDKKEKRVIKDYPKLKFDNGEGVKFKWFDKDLTEIITYGTIIEEPDDLPVVKILGEDHRTYIVAKEWIIERLEGNKQL